MRDPRPEETTLPFTCVSLILTINSVIAYSCFQGLLILPKSATSLHHAQGQLVLHLSLWQIVNLSVRSDQIFLQQRAVHGLLLLSEETRLAPTQSSHSKSACCQCLPHFFLLPPCSFLSLISLPSFLPPSFSLFLLCSLSLFLSYSFLLFPSYFLIIYSHPTYLKPEVY